MRTGPTSKERRAMLRQWTDVLIHKIDTEQEGEQRRKEVYNSLRLLYRIGLRDGLTTFSCDSAAEETNRDR